MKKKFFLRKVNILMLSLLTVGAISPAISVFAEESQSSDTLVSEDTSKEDSFEFGTTQTSEQLEVQDSSSESSEIVEVIPAEAVTYTTQGSQSIRIMHTNDMHGRMEYIEDKYSPSIGMGRVKLLKTNKIQLF